jgi:hypothetical protein
LFCYTHQRPNDVRVKEGNAVCQHQGCRTTATFAGTKEEKPLFCAKHRPLSFANVRSRLCNFGDCKTIPTYGRLFEPRTRCFSHKTAGMFSANRPVCPCGDKQPCWTDQNNNYPLRCEECKIEGDLNVVETKCHTCGLMNLIRQGLVDCSDCQEFHTKQPQKQRELLVKAILDEAKLPYKSHDTIPEASCHRYRPDFLFDWGTHIVILEVDEDQHKNYACECEQARMINLFQDQGGMKTLFVRFNPDNYRDRANKLHKWTAGRGTKLLDVLRQTRDHPPEDLLSAVYLYYDQFDVNAIDFVKLEYGL